MRERKTMNYLQEIKNIRNFLTQNIKLQTKFNLCTFQRYFLKKYTRKLKNKIQKENEM